MEMNRKSFFIPDEGAGRRAVLLSKPISAVELVRNDDGTVGLGRLAQLSPGTEVIDCGDGFNETTVKVRAAGQCYFVFQQDLDSETGKPSY
jgi:hypothetical protein